MNIQELIRTASWLTAEEIMLRPLVQLDSVPTLEEQRVHAESEIGIFYRCCGDCYCLWLR